MKTQEQIFNRVNEILRERLTVWCNDIEITEAYEKDGKYMWVSESGEHFELSTDLNEYERVDYSAPLFYD